MRKIARLSKIVWALKSISLEHKYHLFADAFKFVQLMGYSCHSQIIVQFLLKKQTNNNKHFIHSCTAYIHLCILFVTLIYNINIIHMGATLAELRLLGKNTRHSQVGYIGHRCGRLF